MSNIFDTLLGRSGHACPWWCCFTFDNIIRKLFHDPGKIVSGYIAGGDTVIDIGPGWGYFTIPMARIVGDKGRVVAIDVQRKMLSTLMRKAERDGVAGRITAKLVKQDSLGLDLPADFILAFWMVHEVPDRERFLKEVYACLKPGKYFLIVEPLFHVPGARFAATVADAQSAGFSLIAKPGIAFSRSVLLVK